MAVDPLKAAGCRVWAFGSRVKGTFKTFSDLDLCFEKSIPLSGGLISNIKEALDESRLPVKVDLVDWEDMASEYREEIQSHRKLL